MPTTSVFMLEQHIAKTALIKLHYNTRHNEASARSLSCPHASVSVRTVHLSISEAQ